MDPFVDERQRYAPRLAPLEEVVLEGAVRARQQRLVDRDRSAQCLATWLTRPAHRLKRSNIQLVAVVEPRKRLADEPQFCDRREIERGLRNRRDRDSPMEPALDAATGVDADPGQ